MTAAPSSPLAVWLGIDDEDDWQIQAICASADPEAFFPEKGGATRLAKRVCLNCPVRAECLQAALDRDERFGVWGGLSERERRALKHPTRTKRTTRSTVPGIAQHATGEIEAPQ